MVIRRFDVYRNPEPRSTRSFPYLLVIQSELFDALPTVVVVPLVRTSMLGGRPAERLNPELIVDGEKVYMLTQQLGAVSIKSLTKYLSNLDAARDVITLALDFLFTGI